MLRSQTVARRERERSHTEACGLNPVLLANKKSSSLVKSSS